MRAWVLLALLAQSAAAAEGWVKQGASILLYDSSGTLVNEADLGHTEEAADTAVNAVETLGGVAKSGRFAWTLEKKSSWNPSRTKLLETRTSFRYLSADGTELWKSSKVDVPASGEPVSLSDDGETLAVARRAASGWTAALKSFVGNTQLEVGPFPGLRSVELTPKARYLRVRWDEIDKSSTDTFVEAATKRRKDIPSDQFPPGAGRVDDDGKVWAGTKLVFDFAQEKP